MTDEAFGPLTPPDAVEEAIVATLKLWAGEYLAFVERKAGRPAGSLQLPRSYVQTDDVSRWPEEALPSVLVMNTGLAEEPERRGDGSYCAKLAVGVAVVVGAKDRPSARSLAQLYTAALRAILLNHSDLGGMASAVEWVDEGYDALPGGKPRRQLASGQSVFRVEVPDYGAATVGPLEPRPDPHTPYPAWPNVATTEATVTPEE